MAQRGVSRSHRLAKLQDDGRYSPCCGAPLNGSTKLPRGVRNLHCGECHSLLGVQTSSGREIWRDDLAGRQWSEQRGVPLLVS
jgi:hypothetical protein